MLYALGLLFYVAYSHTMLSWPPPRVDDADSAGGGGLTTGPCGGDEYQIGDSTDTVTEIEPGVNTIIINPVAAHANHQYRIALAKPGNNEVSDDYDECILVDHVPQFTDTSYTPSIETLHINVTIPNVDCDECGLQVYMVQPSGTCCNKHNDSCQTTYYSCATVKITGSKSWSDRKCEQPCVWGYRDFPTNHYQGDQDDTYWTADGTELWLDYTASYVTPPTDTCCNQAENYDSDYACTDTEDDKCKWFDTSSSNSNSNSGKSGYSSSEKKTGEEAGIAIFILILIAIGGTLAYTYFCKKKPLNEGNGAVFLATTTPSGQLRSNTVGSIQNNVVTDGTSYVTGGETTQQNSPPVVPQTYNQPTEEAPQFEEYQPEPEQQQYQQEEVQQYEEPKQQQYEEPVTKPQPPPRPFQPEPEPETYQQEVNEYQQEEVQQNYEEPQQNYEEPQQNYEEPQNYEEQNYQEPDDYQNNDDNAPTTGYDM